MGLPKLSFLVGKRSEDSEIQPQSRTAGSASATPCAAAAGSTVSLKTTTYTVFSSKPIGHKLRLGRTCQERRNEFQR
jgi:hypothetical protein